MQPPLDLLDQPVGYEALVGLVQVNEGYPLPTSPPPFDNTAANYGLSKILCRALFDVDVQAGLIDAYKQDNTTEEIIRLIFDILVPNLWNHIDNQTNAAADIQAKALNILAHFLWGEAYDPTG